MQLYAAVIFGEKTQKIDLHLRKKFSLESEKRKFQSEEKSDIVWRRLESHLFHDLNAKFLVGSLRVSASSVYVASGMTVRNHCLL